MAASFLEDFIVTRLCEDDVHQGSGTVLHFRGTRDQCREAADKLVEADTDRVTYMTVREYIDSLPKLAPVEDIPTKINRIFDSAKKVKTAKDAIYFHLNTKDWIKWDHHAVAMYNDRFYCARHVKDGNQNLPSGYGWVRDPDTPLGIHGWEIYKA